MRRIAFVRFVPGMSGVLIMRREVFDANECASNYASLLPQITGPVLRYWSQEARQYPWLISISRQL